MDIVKKISLFLGEDDAVPGRYTNPNMAWREDQWKKAAGDTEDGEDPNGIPAEEIGKETRYPKKGEMPISKYMNVDYTNGKGVDAMGTGTKGINESVWQDYIKNCLKKEKKSLGDMDDEETKAFFAKAKANFEKK